MAWTPPGPIRLTTWSRPPARARPVAGREERRPRRRTTRRRSRRRSAAGPGAPAARRRGSGGRPRSCPSGPGGSPTASSDARRTRCGQRASRPRQTGIARGRDRVVGRDRADAEPVDDDEHDRARPARPAVTRPVTSRGSRRGRAVTPARPTIPAISSGLSDAPPTSAPSIAGSARNSPMFAAVTLPPYRTGTSSARRPRPAEPAEASPGSPRPSRPRPRPRALRPVPIAQTGSYAIDEARAASAPRRRDPRGRRGAARRRPRRAAARARDRRAARRRTGSGADRPRRARAELAPISSSVSPARGAARCGRRSPTSRARRASAREISPV